MSYTYGYVRASTQQQALDRQLDALAHYHCNEILQEKTTGTKSDRPQLLRLQDKVRPGDMVVESWSQLGRSTADLLALVQWFADHEVQLISLKENFDTATPQGRLMMTVFSAMAAFERDLIVQRMREGLASARARGRKGGRPPKRTRDVDTALRLYGTGAHSIKEITRLSGVSASTLYRYLRKKQQPV